jgi:hypothetical protein
MIRTASFCFPALSGEKFTFRTHDFPGSRTCGQLSEVTVNESVLVEGIPSNVTSTAFLPLGLVIVIFWLALVVPSFRLAKVREVGTILSFTATAVGAGLGVGVGDAVGVGVGVGVEVAAGAGVGVGGGAGVGVSVGDGVAVGVKVDVAVEVAVGVGV